MRSPDLTDTGLDLDLAGTADELVALVQRAVAASGEDAQQTRHYVAIDGGTSADIRLRVVSVDDPAPLLAFAITTAPSARGTAASTFIMQHGVQKKRRQRSLLGQEPFLSFLRALAGLVSDADPDASATLRVHGARTVLAPRAAVSTGSEPAVPETAPASAPVTGAPAIQSWVPAAVDEQAPAQAHPAEIPAQNSAGSTPVSAPPVTGAASEPWTEAQASEVQASEVPAAEPHAGPSEPAPVVASVVAAPPASAPPASPPQFREPPTAPAHAHAPAASTSSVPPELQITVPPGLIAGAPAAPRPATPEPVRPTDGVAVQAEDVGATVVSSSLRAGDFALELPGGERIPLSGPILLGRNPSARPEQPDAELRALVDPRMSVSKTHTVVVPGRRSLRVTDLHSTNGTTITDASGAVTVCQPGEAYVVEAGSTIGIGEFPIRVVAG